MSYDLNLPNHKAGEKCPACSPEHDKGGRLTLRQSKFRSMSGQLKYWLSCSRYPDCKFTVSGARTKHNHMPHSCSCPSLYRVVGKSGHAFMRRSPVKYGKMVKEHKPSCAYTPKERQRV